MKLIRALLLGILPLIIPVCLLAEADPTGNNITYGTVGEGGVFQVAPEKKALFDKLHPLHVRPLYFKGDANGDGVVTQADVGVVDQNEGVVFDQPGYRSSLKSADMNSNFRIDAGDTTLLTEYLSSLNNHAPLRLTQHGTLLSPNSLSGIFASPVLKNGHGTILVDPALGEVGKDVKIAVTGGQATLKLAGEFNGVYIEAGCAKTDPSGDLTITIEGKKYYVIKMYCGGRDVLIPVDPEPSPSTSTPPSPSPSASPSPPEEPTPTPSPEFPARKISICKYKDEGTCGVLVIQLVDPEESYATGKPALNQALASIQHNSSCKFFIFDIYNYPDVWDFPDRPVGVTNQQYQDQIVTPWRNTNVKRANKDLDKVIKNFADYTATGIEWSLDYVSAHGSDDGQWGNSIGVVYTLQYSYYGTLHDGRKFHTCSNVSLISSCYAGLGVRRVANRNKTKCERAGHDLNMAVASSSAWNVTWFDQARHFSQLFANGIDTGFALGGDPSAAIGHAFANCTSPNHNHTAAPTFYYDDGHGTCPHPGDPANCLKVIHLQ